MKLDTPEKIKLFLQKNKNSNYVDANKIIYLIKGGELKTIHPNKYNTWEFIEELKKELTDNKQHHLEHILRMTKVIDNLNGAEFNKSEVEKMCDMGSLNHPLDALDALSELGIYPPPLIIEAIVEAYRHYKKFSCDITHDDAFFGKYDENLDKLFSHYGSPSVNEQAIAMMDMFVKINKTVLMNEKNSLIKNAESVVEYYKLPIDPESFLRKYRRYRK